MPSPDVMEMADWLNNIISHAVKLYILKCHFENDEIHFKPLLIPSANTYKKPQTKITNTKEKQNEFWQELHKYTSENDSPIKIAHPAPQHWQYITIGISGVSIQLTINTPKNYLGCELLIADDKDLFHKLEGFKNDIEKPLGKLDWQVLEGKKSSRIRTTLDFDIENKENLEQGFKWLTDTAENFKNVFIPYLKGNTEK